MQGQGNKVDVAALNLPLAVCSLSLYIFKCIDSYVEVLLFRKTDDLPPKMKDYSLKCQNSQPFSDSVGKIELLLHP